MQVSVSITLTPEELYSEKLSGNAAELASAVLKAVGGDEEIDVCNVNISDSGSAGTWAMTPAPISPPPKEPPPIEP